MKRILLVTALFFYVFTLNAQTKHLDCMQGIWKYYREDNLIAFSIQNGFNVLNFYYEPDGSELGFRELITGFLNYNPNDSGMVHYSDLKKEGRYYVEFWRSEMDEDSIFRSSYFITPDFGECDSTSFFVENPQPFDYTRLKRLPSRAIRYMYEKDKKSGSNYIAEYLGIKVAQVKVEKSTIYSSPNVATKMFLKKGDVPTILKEQGDWLKIEYLETNLITGWIKKTDVD